MYYCIVKDKIPILQRFSFIYQITCPGSLERYVGKVDCVYIRMDEHCRKLDQLMHKHLKNCSYFQKLGHLYSLLCDSKIVDIDLKEHSIDAVLKNPTH